MKVKLYSIYDKQANVFAAPFCAVNDAIAERMVKGTLSDSENPDNKLVLWPTDFALYSLGEFDDGTKIVGYEQPVHIIEVSQLFNEIQRKQD